MLPLLPPALVLITPLMQLVWGYQLVSFIALISLSPAKMMETPTTDNDRHIQIDAPSTIPPVIQTDNQHRHARTDSMVTTASGRRTHRQRAASILTNRDTQDGRQTYEEVQGIVSRHGPNDIRTLLLGGVQNLLGSFVLGVISIGSINVLQAPVDAALAPLYALMNRLIISLSFGFGLTVAGHDFSAGAFNPAVIQAQYTLGQISARQAAADLVATFAGWMSAAALMSAIRGELGGTLSVQPGHTFAESMGFEVLLGGVFVYSIMELILMKPVSSQSLFVLFTLITGIHLVGIPINGCGINQARALATAVVNRDFGPGHDFAAYMVGPIFGALLADLTIRAQRYLQADSVPVDKINADARGGQQLVARERVVEEV